MRRATVPASPEAKTGSQPEHNHMMRFFELEPSTYRALVLLSFRPRTAHFLSKVGAPKAQLKRLADRHVVGREGNVFYLNNVGKAFLDVIHAAE